MEALEFEVKALHVALEQVQATLTSPELARQSLKEQLAQRQVTVRAVFGFFIHLMKRRIVISLCSTMQTCVSASPGRHGELQAAGAGGAAVPERAAGP